MSLGENISSYIIFKASDVEKKYFQIIRSAIKINCKKCTSGIIFRKIVSCSSTLDFIFKSFSKKKNNYYCLVF